MSQALRLSATSIGRFKACPTQFRYADVEGLRPVEDADALRIGTNWHALQESYQVALLEWVKEEVEPGENPDALGLTWKDAPEFAFHQAIRHLNEAYAKVPASKTVEEWAVERESLVALFIGHRWHWADDEITTVATEIPFWLPLHHPRTGMPLSANKVVRLGKIDRLITRNGILMQNEYKTTSSDVSPTSSYWPRLRLNTQVSMYDLALRDGIEGDAFEVEFPDLPLGGCLYDVTRKPTISPKKLTQADSKAFVENGLYMEEQFAVDVTSSPDSTTYTIDGWTAEITPGKKDGTFAIRETPGMFRARLVQDIYTRPEHYFARQEIPRTQKDRTRFRTELYAIYRSMQHAVETGYFYHNEDQCDQWGGCDYCDICQHDIDVLDGQTPDGMKRIFTPITTKETE